MRIPAFVAGAMFALMDAYLSSADPAFAQAQLECGDLFENSDVGVRTDDNVSFFVYSRVQSPPQTGDGSDEIDRQIEISMPWIFSREEWIVSCQDDPMTDKRSCRAWAGASLGSLERGTTNAAFEFTGLGGITSICVNGNNFPGQIGAIRVGEAPPYETDEDGCIDNPRIVRGIVDRLVVGARLRTRHVQWPNDTAIDDDYLVTSVMLSAIKFGHCLFSKKTLPAPRR